MLTNTNNQLNQKIANIMTYKVYTHTHTNTHTLIHAHTHTHTHTHVYIPLFHITIKGNVYFSINI